MGGRKIVEKITKPLSSMGFLHILTVENVWKLYGKLFRFFPSTLRLPFKIHLCRSLVADGLMVPFVIVKFKIPA